MHTVLLSLEPKQMEQCCIYSYLLNMSKKNEQKKMNKKKNVFDLNYLIEYIWSYSLLNHVDYELSKTLNNFHWISIL